MARVDYFGQMVIHMKETGYKVFNMVKVYGSQKMENNTMVNGKIIKGMVMVFGLMENKNMKESISKENNMDKVFGHLERVKSMKDSGCFIKDMGLGFGINFAKK